MLFVKPGQRPLKKIENTTTAKLASIDPHWAHVVKYGPLLAP